MPRSGPGVYTLPANYEAVDGELATAAQHNDPFEDIQTDLNTVRPIVAGGTGSDTAVEALDALTVKSANIASAATTNLATATGRLVHITGSVTITAFGTLTAGIERELVFDAAPLLTHNATSLILPSGANIQTAAGDTATFVSEGSGNWRMLNYQSRSLTMGTVVATTSGTTVPFTGFPAGTKRITISVSGLSTNGTNNLGLTLGDAGGLETSGYNSTNARLVASPTFATSTAAFLILSSVTAASTYSGVLILTLLNPATFLWTCTGNVAVDGLNAINITAGNKALSAELTQIEFAAGGNTFDAGSINVMYE